MQKSTIKSRNVLLTITLFFASVALPVAAFAQQATIAQAQEFPDSPGATLAKLQPATPLQDAVTQSPDQSATPSASRTNSIQPLDQPQPAAPQASQTQSSPQKPEGTAAAEASGARGIAASQPSGVAIAPAKQRRVRTIWIRTGAILGAGVAVGSVFALTQATSSKPPGAH